MSDKELVSCVVNKIYQQYGIDGLNHFRQTKELPPLKLTSEEMEVISGGGLWQDILDVVDQIKDSFGY